MSSQSAHTFAGSHSVPHGRVACLRKTSPLLRWQRHLKLRRPLPTQFQWNRERTLPIVNSYPEPETEKERSTLDFPQEWITPQPSRRPDVFPEFEKLETPLPKPLPGDPTLPDEEEEEEKKKEEPEKDPEEEPDKPEGPPQEE